MRYREVLENLAVVADNPGNLPAFALTAGGITMVTDTGQAESVTVWDHAIKGFSKQTLSVLAKRNPDQSWTLDPVVSQPQLEALHYACLWALQGPPPPDSAAMDLLRAPRPGDVSGYHFHVARQLAALPAGWLHVGSHNEVPKNACYVAQCHHKHVWVTADGMEGLSQFTLILLDIATVYPPSLVLQQPLATLELTVEGEGKQKKTVTTTVPAQQNNVFGNETVMPGSKVTVGCPKLNNLPEIAFGEVAMVPQDPKPRIATSRAVLSQSR
jgi:hypothetical protein